ncbi:DUF2768 family protein [Paenibacillus sp. HJGM_3]|uniref:DUF2768 family protein n=1 Tax=Paenibacillus sp. HJGM_3 TaxID=3379816 RepID=UPI00385DE3A0
MDGLTKMWASFTGMGLMIAASFLITFARLKLKGIIRGVVSTVAFLLLLLSIVYMLISIM